MYQTPHFRQTDHDALFSFIESNPLGLLITAGSGGLIANPLPFFLRRAGNAQGQDCLIAHMARANPQWQEIEAGADVLVSFMGADHYVSPNWYPSKQESGKVVPTWNYQTVQVRGSMRTHHDPAWLLSQVRLLTDQQEASELHPWAVDDAPEKFVAAQMRGIVGVELEIASLEGKLKASQNRTDIDRQGVLDGLGGQQTPQADAMAALMRRAKS
ncbi:FMN-binding negative transcriptional regulator [Agrobacterium vitis]|uniref:FMN-binding negative transcriptional regulator n=1 Tax=Agrobacterium vitis TaxID=373 RepID=A0ABD6GAW0_AGRVI|nr:FMN-binding negative transcriptional regulator [Agrobacterium vitis]MUO94109.1 FMN-binding negative transcriptional regulator [Agrobacterium vitis]MUP03436.1 FMN-binding negative transcriptional regulator [Agrobacterium vitis]MUZ84983.1 FMN-binding negative transcriptional regulator [Agrobacterium vitis]MVA10223.1 FMN-binding negative transcriptional regulator [Agrobacterium vitis]